MPGKESVYQRQGGTGAAAILGGTSWDPVQFAKYAGTVKMAQEQAKQQKAQKAQDDFFKSIKVKGGKVLADDWSFMSQAQDDFYKWAAGESTKAGGITPQIMARGQQEASKIQSNFDRLGVQKEKVDNYHKLILSSSGGQNPIYDSDAMYKNEAIYTQPYQYMNDPQYGEQIQETWLPMYEEAMKDPINALNPERTAKEVTLDWRDNYGEDFIGTPIYNPISLQKNFKDNVQPILSEIKKYKSVRDANGSVITEENLYTLADDTEVEVELADGTKQTITMPGVRSIAGENYDTDVTVSRSANQLFYKQGDGVIEEYKNEYGQDAAKEWYKDQAQNWGLQATSKSIRQAPLPKEGRYGYRGKTYGFEVSLDEGEHNYNRLGTFDTKGKQGIVYSYAQVPVRGISFGSDKNKYPKVKVNPKRIFNQDSYSWMQSETGQDFDFTVSGVYEMPAISQEINLKSPEYAGFLDWASKTYGKKANTGIAERIRQGDYTVASDTPLSKDEARLLRKINPNLVKSGKFATGQISGYDIATNKPFEIPGATIPYEEVQTQVEDATDGAWAFEIDDQYGTDPNWWDSRPVIKSSNKEPKSSVAPKQKTNTLEDIKINTGGTYTGGAENLN